MSQEMVARFGADDRQFRRTLRDMERQSDRTFGNIGRHAQRGIGRAIGVIISVSTVTRAAIGTLNAYANRYEFARREVDAFTRSTRSLSDGIGRDLFAGISGTNSQISQMIDGLEKGRRAWVDFLADGYRSVFTLSNQFGNSAATRAAQEQAERIDQQNRSRLFTDDRMAGLQASALDRSGRTAAAEEIRINQELRRTQTELNTALRDGKIVYEDFVRLRDAAAADAAERIAKAQRDEAAALREANEQARRQGMATAADLAQGVAARRAAALRRGGDEFGARRTEIESDFQRRMLDLDGVDGLNGALQRGAARADRDSALADLEHERDLRRQMLADEIRRGEITVRRAQGDREGAERAAIELEFAQRIRDVERDGLLTSQERAEAIQSFQRQRDALLGQVEGPEQGGGRTVPTGLNAAVARVALGTGGAATEKNTAMTVAELRQANTHLAAVADGIRTLEFRA